MYPGSIREYVHPVHIKSSPNNLFKNYNIAGKATSSIALLQSVH